MRKVLIAAVGAATMAFAAPALAQEPVVEVTESDIVGLSPVGSPVGDVFTGEYDAGDSDGDGVNETGTQEGYIAVYEDGVEACNGNPAYVNPSDNQPFVGYIWVGPSHAADGYVLGATPGNEIGAGNNHQNADDRSPTGASPCPRNGG